jgi:hypothetical protein
LTATATGRFLDHLDCRRGFRGQFTPAPGPAGATKINVTDAANLLAGETITVDTGGASSGNVYVADTANDAIEKYSPSVPPVGDHRARRPGTPFGSMVGFADESQCGPRLTLDTAVYTMPQTRDANVSVVGRLGTWFGSDW